MKTNEKRGNRDDFNNDGDDGTRIKQEADEQGQQDF